MKACVVKFKDLGKSWSVHKIMDDPLIKKYCCKCGTELMALEILEKGKVDDILYCHNCGGKHGHK